jgi:hypothetical protein
MSSNRSRRHIQRNPRNAIGPNDGKRSTGSCSASPRAHLGNARSQRSKSGSAISVDRGLRWPIDVLASSALNAASLYAPLKIWQIAWTKHIFSQGSGCRLASSMDATTAAISVSARSFSSVRPRLWESRSFIQTAAPTEIDTPSHLAASCKASRFPPDASPAP